MMTRSSSRKGLVLVWTGTVITPQEEKAAEEFFLSDFGVRMTYRGTIETQPGLGGEGGHLDAVFSLHHEDKEKFAASRFRLRDPPIWWETYLREYGQVVSAKDKKKYSF